MLHPTTTGRDRLALYPPSISSCNQLTATSPRPPDHCSKTELKTELTETEPLLTGTPGWITEWRSYG